MSYTIAYVLSALVFNPSIGDIVTLQHMQVWGNQGRVSKRVYWVSD